MRGATRRGVVEFGPVDVVRGMGWVRLSASWCGPVDCGSAWYGTHRYGIGLLEKFSSPIFQLKLLRLRCRS